MSEVRLFKAARRTIRAECTLVIFIVIIISWSIYALYKLNIGGSDSILGLSISKLIGGSGGESGGDKSLKSSNYTTSNNLVGQQPSEETHQLPIYLPPEEIKQRSDLLRQLIASKRRQLFERGDTSDRVDQNNALRAPNALAALERLKLNNHDHQKQLLQQQLARHQLQHHPMGRLQSLYSAHQVQDPRVTNRLNELLQRQLASSHRESSREDEPATNEDETDDRYNHSTQADEESAAPQPDREPSESSISDTELPSQPKEDDNQENSDLETTTIENPDAAEAPMTDVGEDTTEQPPEDESDTPATEEPVNIQESDAEPTAEDEAKAQETGQAIDEDVDRMTQPSSGVASRQDKPFDYKSTVQFDDALTSADPTLVKTEVKGKNRRRIDLRKPGGQVARFVAPTRRRDSDLEMDHNKLVPLNNHKKREPIVTHKNKIKVAPVSKVNSTSQAVETNQPPPRRKSVRSRRWIAVDVAGSLTLNETHLTAPSDVSVRKTRKRRLKRRHRRPPPGANLNSTSIRRSDDDNDEDDAEERDAESDDYEETPEGDQENEEQPQVEQVDEKPEVKPWSPPKRSSVSSQPADSSRYHYLTSADANLQELLDQQRLLDALTQSQPPAPIMSEPTSQNATHKPKDKHQGSDSQITIEEGLLLYPAGGEDHHYKSMKKKKGHKSKHKKKMTVAMKKGGHKKKKHKKEEKKYLKEKKFKGAKKGKKSSKGKGGQGGKKGKKFYKDKGFKKKGFKNVYHKEEFGQKKSYFDEFRDKDFKKKWKKYDDKYNYAKMKKWQAKDVKGAKKMKDQGEKYKKYDKGKWKKKYMKHHEEAKKKKMASEWDK